MDRGDAHTVTASLMRSYAISVVGRCRRADHLNDITRPRGMEHGFVAEVDRYMANLSGSFMPLGVGEKEQWQVEFTTQDGGILIDGIPWNDQPRRTGAHMNKARAIDAPATQSRPEIANPKKLF